MSRIIVRTYSNTARVKHWLAIRLIWLAACLINAEIQVTK